MIRDEFKGVKTIANIIFSKFPNLSEDSLKDQSLLIHGYVQSYYGKRIKHAWIESNDYVIEYSGSNKIVELKKDYYRNNRATSVAQFSPQSAMDFLAKGYAVGFWRHPEEVYKVEPPPSFEEVLQLDFVELYLKDGQLK